MHVAHVSTSHASQDVRFWLWWVGMTTLGWFVGWWVGFALGFLLGNATLVVAASAGAGLMQWWVLSVSYPALAHRWRWWVLASAAGTAVAVVPYLLIWGDPTFDMRWLPAIMLGGALVGALQQRILRHVCARSWWWIPACTAGWALGMAGLFVLDQVLPEMTLVIPDFFVSSALAGLLLALITGSMLVWLLRQPAQLARPPAASRRSRLPRGVQLWFWWVTMTALGWLVGWWVGFALGFLPSPGTTRLVCYSVGVGLTQWMLLRLTHASPAHRWRWWVPASIAGMAAPLVISSLIWGDLPVDLRFDDLRGLLAIGLGGALVGLLQQRILRRVSARSWWWVPACVVGWVLVALPPASILQTYGPLSFGLIQGLLLALITGSVLVWLLRQPAVAEAA